RPILRKWQDDQRTAHPLIKQRRRPRGLDVKNGCLSLGDREALRLLGNHRGRSQHQPCIHAYHGPGRELSDNGIIPSVRRLHVRDSQRPAVLPWNWVALKSPLKRRWRVSGGIERSRSELPCAIDGHVKAQRIHHYPWPVRKHHKHASGRQDYGYNVPAVRPKAIRSRRSLWSWRQVRQRSVKLIYDVARLGSKPHQILESARFESLAADKIRPKCRVEPRTRGGPHATDDAYERHRHVQKGAFSGIQRAGRRPDGGLHPLFIKDVIGKLYIVTRRGIEFRQLRPVGHVRKEFVECIAPYNEWVGNGVPAGSEVQRIGK